MPDYFFLKQLMDGQKAPLCVGNIILRGCTGDPHPHSPLPIHAHMWDNDKNITACSLI